MDPNVICPFTSAHILCSMYIMKKTFFVYTKKCTIFTIIENSEESRKLFHEYRDKKPFNRFYTAAIFSLFLDFACTSFVNIIV